MMNGPGVHHSSFIIHHSSFVRVKILDFGLARAASDTSLTQSGAIVGTPAYMAPEQAAGQPLDHRCDLFSLGCVLYRMCTGQTPFKGANTLAILRSLAIDTPPAPQTLDRTIPPKLSDLIMKLLAKDPAGRPASAVAVADTLRALEKDRNDERGMMNDKQPKDSSLIIPRSSFSRRRRALIAAAALIVLAPLAYLSAPTIIRFATNKGEVVIQTDKDVEVTLLQGGQKVKIHDTKTGRAFEINPGAYDLLIRELPEGLEFKAQSFTLRRGGSKVIDVRWELAKAKPPTPAGSPNASLLDRLDPAQIAPRNRFDWQPKELVAVLGTSPLHKGGTVAVSAAGHYRGTPAQAVARQLVYVVDTGHGQETLTPAEFEKKYNWKNDPEQVRLAP